MKNVEVKNADGSVGLYIDEQKTTPIFYALSDIPGSAANSNSYTPPSHNGNT